MVTVEVDRLVDPKYVVIQEGQNEWCVVDRTRTMPERISAHYPDERMASFHATVISLLPPHFRLRFESSEIWVLRDGGWLVAWPHDPDDYGDGITSLVNAAWKHIVELYPDNVRIRDTYSTVLRLVDSLASQQTQPPSPDKGTWSRFMTWLRS
jgi:hypothetical protein